ncbi:50S ribosomal protein 6, chloroplastic [Capsicum chinense]|nr:50S ribosomal protein 6, chloroplastic [Capsicum chinense]
MSASAIFGLKMPVLPRFSPISTTAFSGGATTTKLPAAAPMVIECSSRPQKKATAHHQKTRPKKTQPWDIRRKPTLYPPMPTLPPEWSFATDESVSGQPTSAPASESDA